MISSPIFSKVPLVLLSVVLLASLTVSRAEESEEANHATTRTMQQLGKGVLRYIRARGVLPLLKNPVSPDSTRVFYPYVNDERLFMHPVTGKVFPWNEILSGKKVAHITNPQSMAMFYEATPAGDETRGVLFLDGHVERVKPAHWEKIKRASKIFDRKL